MLALCFVTVGACGGDDDAGSATTLDVATTAAATETTTTAASAPTTPSSMTPAPLTQPTTAPPTSAPNTSVPAGTELRVADQFGLFEGVLGFAEMDQDIPYDVRYATLSPGPTQVQAFIAGDVDVGVVSPLGLIQAGSGGVELRAVGRWRTDFALFALITAPGVEGIAGWGDLRGKRVAFQRNTMGEALVLLELDRLGMSLDDIDVVDVPHVQVTTVLQQGDADVGVTGEPFVSTYLTDNPTATYVLGIEEPLAESTLIVASDSALADPAKAAAIAEYVARLDRAFTSLTSDRTKFADLVVAVWNLDRAYVEGVLEESNGVDVVAVPGDLLEPYERLATLLAERGDISDDLDVAVLFDDRFDSLLRG